MSDAAVARYEAFLRGDRPDDVLIYLHEEGVGSVEDLLDIGTRVQDGVVLVLPGEEGKAAFESATGLDPMDFAGTAMETDGRVDADCTGGDCPAAGEPPDEDGESPGVSTEASDDGQSGEQGDHHLKFVFAFAEAQNEAVGGLYAEGDVVHAYAACACGTTFSDRWVTEKRAA
jgi:hypothetical protein